MESDLQQQLEVARDEVLKLQKELDESRKQQAEASAEDGWGFEASSSAQDASEVSRLKEEPEEVRKQLGDQTEVQFEHETSEIERHVREKAQIEGELSAVRKELERMQQLLMEKDHSLATEDKPEEEWGWGDAQPQGSDEITALQEKLSQMETVERQQKETIRKQEAKINALEEELSTADTCREELEDATQQVNELQRELREMKRRAQVQSEEQQRLTARIAELETKKENAWGDEWDTTTDKNDEGRQALEQSRTEAYEKIAELELQIEQKVCALVDAEKELTLLRERLETIGTEKSGTQ
ncbi:hypothetical protein GCK32_019332, partial [Trichostrongylus colubriformis]